MLLPTEYNLIFWAYGKHDPTKIVLEINEFLHQYGNNYMPKILAGKEVVLSPVSLRNELKAWGNEEGMAVGLKSLNGIVLRVTTNDKEYKHSKFPDTLRIGFDYKHLIGIEPTLIFGQLQDIFNFCLKIFLPYYGYGNKSGEINSSPERRQLRKKLIQTKYQWQLEGLTSLDQIGFKDLGVKASCCPLQFSRPSLLKN